MKFPLEYSCNVRIDIFGAELGHFGRFRLDWGCVGTCRVPRRGVRRDRDAHAGSRGEGLTTQGVWCYIWFSQLVSSSLSIGIYVVDSPHL